MVKFYYEEMLPTGRYSPRIGEKPETQGAEGRRKKIKSLKEVKSEHENLPLNVLEYIYGEKNV